MSNTIRSDEEIEALLNHPKNGVKKIVDVKIIGSGGHGRQGIEKDTEKRIITNEDKAEIAVLAEFIGNKAASELFDLQPGQVSRFKKGMDSSGNVAQGVSELKDDKLAKISDKAMDKVETLLDIFAKEKMTELKASEIPGAAEKLVGIFDKLRPASLNGQSLKPQVVIYAPKQLTVNEYIAKEV